MSKHGYNGPSRCDDFQWMNDMDYSIKKDKAKGNMVNKSRVLKLNVNIIIEKLMVLKTFTIV